MNLTTVLVAVVIAGSATPGISRMAIQPVVAQKRATNFGIAESQAVTFAAMNEGKMSLTSTPEQCELENIGNNAFAITCWEGESKYKMSATRAFRVGTSAGGIGTVNPGSNPITAMQGSTAQSGTVNAGGSSGDADYTPGNVSQITHNDQSSGGDISGGENYPSQENHQADNSTSSNDNHTTSQDQSSRDKTSKDEKYTTGEDQSSGDKTSRDGKKKKDCDKSSKDRRSSKEQHATNDSYYSKDEQSRNTKEQHHQHDPRYNESKYHDPRYNDSRYRDARYRDPGYNEKGRTHQESQHDVYRVNTRKSSYYPRVITTNRTRSSYRITQMGIRRR